MKPLFTKALFGVAGLACFTSSAMAAFVFTDDDIVLGFQASGGQGSNTSLYFNLGPSVALRDGLTNGILGNLSDDLIANYGAGWYSRTDLYFGAFGNRTNESAAGSPGSPPSIEAGRTLYVSSPVLVPNSSVLRQQLGNTATGNTATAYAGLRTNLTGASNPGLIVETAFGDGAARQIDDGSGTFDNSWTDLVATPGFGFNNFQNIEQNFGAGGTFRMIDIQRLVPHIGSGTSFGTHEGTIAIFSDGTISAVPEASSSLALIAMGTFAGLRRRRNR